MQTYSITANPPQQGPKNYVFVDEHNRHKRLKVMRACEGCRRRKIRCDSATTNTWPCAACTRLKLHCVPPAGGIDGDPASDPISSIEPPLELSQPTTFAQQGYSGPFPSDPSQSFETYHHYDSQFHKASYFQPDEAYPGLYSEQQQYSDPTLDSYQMTRPAYSQPRSNSDAQRSQSSGTPIEHSKIEDLNQRMGDLQILETGVAPYVRQQKKDGIEPEGPIRDEQEDAEDEVEKAFRTEAGSHIRIPPALMPSNEDAAALFEVFFRDIHPYVPVLNRSQFYHQWHTDKESISPLVLEAVFACAGRIAEEPSEGAQWLALANKHEAYFLDSPRLSTVQALLLLLKAREGSPKRGYYYRSWMTCKTIVSMARDLELHEHLEIHSNGEDCDSDPVECLTKTRVWQTALICEMMVGAPQGRYDMGVDPNSVDISTSPPQADVDVFEKSISRQFVFFLRNARNIRLISDVARRAAKKKDGALGKELMAYNMAFHKWPDDLPTDLDITMPSDGSLPILASHFIGNMHSHYHLGIVMLRRPQLAASDKFAEDPAWREHMSVCYNSAKILCRLQEAILAQHGLTGLLCMQRGISFTIYAVLTCVMIHLIAITVPDLEWYADARDYFVRQMRILEQCIDHWAVPETVAQINALRAAFSADLTKPFELKSSFPLGTPETYQSSPPHSQPSNGLSYSQHQHPPQRQLLIPPTQPYLSQQMSQLQQGSYLATPPVSAVSGDSKPHSPRFQQPFDQQAYGAMSTSSFFQQPTPTDQPAWNPTPIIDQFNTAFAIPASALAPPGTYGSPTSQQQVPGMSVSSAGYTPSPPYPSSAVYPPPQPQVQAHPHTQQQQFYQAQQHPHPHQHVTQPQAYLDSTSTALGTAHRQHQHPHHHQHQQQQQTQPQTQMQHPAHQHPHQTPHPQSQQPTSQQQQQQQQQQSQVQAQSQSQSQLQTPLSAHNPYVAGAVYVTPKEWQRSVASVFDPGGLKRRWDGGG